MRAWVDQDSLEHGVLEVLIDLEGDEAIDLELPDGSPVSIAESEVTDMADNAVMVVDGIKSKDKEN
jgi:hypothetical protein